MLYSFQLFPTSPTPPIHFRFLKLVRSLLIPTTKSIVFISFLFFFSFVKCRNPCNIYPFVPLIIFRFLNRPLLFLPLRISQSVSISIICPSLLFLSTSIMTSHTFIIFLPSIFQFTSSKNTKNTSDNTTGISS